MLPPRDTGSSQVTGPRVDYLEKDQVYHVHVIQDAEQEAKDLAATKAKYAAAQKAREEETTKGPKAESCSCIEGNPCVDQYGCLDWKNRFEVAAKHGWKLDPHHANKCSM